MSQTLARFTVVGEKKKASVWASSRPTLKRRGKWGGSRSKSCRAHLDRFASNKNTSRLMAGMISDRGARLWMSLPSTFDVVEVSGCALKSVQTRPLIVRARLRSIHRNCAA